MKRVSWLGLIIVGVFALGLCLAPLPAGAKGKPIILGIPTSLYTPFGRGCRDAAKLAVAEINAAGGVKVGGQMRPFKIVVSDTRGGEPGTPVHDALMAYEKLISGQKPHAIVVGAFRSEVLIASMDLVAKYKVPQLGTIAQTPGFQKKFAKDPKKYKYLFRVTTDALTPATYIAATLAMIKKQYKLERILFIYQDTLWAKAFAGLLRKLGKKQGWKEVAFQAYAAGATDFSPALTKARAGKAQVIAMIWDVPLGAGIFCKQYTAMRVPSLLVGFIPPLGSPTAAKTLGPGVEHSITVEFPIGASLALMKYAPTGAFLGKFQKMFGHLPEAPAVNSSAYDAVYILKAAIERANSLDPDKLVAALEKTDYQGVSGRLRFNKKHIAVFGHKDLKKTGVAVVFQWQKKGGKLVRVPVYPAFLAESQIKLPPWMKK